MIIFFLCFFLFSAVIAVKIIGNLDDVTEYNEVINLYIYFDEQYSQNFDNIFTSIYIFYALGSPDLYPDAILPAFYNSKYYLIFFLTYLILFALIFLPIPVAVVFDAYKSHRGEILIMDRLRQREALLACFIALDINASK